MVKGTGLTDKEVRVLTRLVDGPFLCFWTGGAIETLWWLRYVRIEGWGLWSTVSITPAGRAALAERGGVE